MNEILHNSSYDIDMKFGRVTKPNKRSMTNSKKVDNDVISQNCDFVVFFLIYCKFAAISELCSRRMVSKSYIFINSNLL